MQPSSRGAATFILDKEDNKFYLFGGANAEGHLNDFYSYDIENKVWEKVQCEGEGPKAREMNTAHLY